MKSRGDMLYKQLFGHPEMVRDLLAGFVSTEWARALDVGAFERVNASYASERGRERHEDIVWRARIGGDWVYVYLLLEFQSRPDPWMALRMQVYVGLLCQDLVVQHRLTRFGKLPPVLPIVLYHGRKPWRASTDLAELMLPPPEGLEPFQPSQRYLLIDHRRNIGADGRSNVLAMLFRLMRSHTDAEMREVLDAIVERMKMPDMLRARESLSHWIQSVLQNEFCDTNISLEEGPAMLFDQRFKKYEDLLEYEAIERGRVKGREEGREEGRKAGRKASRKVGRKVCAWRCKTSCIACLVTARRIFRRRWARRSRRPVRRNSEAGSDHWPRAPSRSSYSPGIDAASALNSAPRPAA